MAAIHVRKGRLTMTATILRFPERNPPAITPERQAWLHRLADSLRVTPEEQEEIEARKAADVFGRTKDSFILRREMLRLGYSGEQVEKEVELFRALSIPERDAILAGIIEQR